MQSTEPSLHNLIIIRHWNKNIFNNKSLSIYTEIANGTIYSETRFCASVQPIGCDAWSSCTFITNSTPDVMAELWHFNCYACTCTCINEYTIIFTEQIARVVGPVELSATKYLQVLLYIWAVVQCSICHDWRKGTYICYCFIRKIWLTP